MEPTKRTESCLSRTFLPQLPQHLVQRGHPCFETVAYWRQRYNAYPDDAIKLALHLPPVTSTTSTTYSTTTPSPQYDQDSEHKSRRLHTSLNPAQHESLQPSQPPVGSSSEVFTNLLTLLGKNKLSYKKWFPVFLLEQSSKSASNIDLNKTPFRSFLVY